MLRSHTTLYHGHEVPLFLISSCFCFVFKGIGVAQWVQWLGYGLNTRSSIPGGGSPPRPPALMSVNLTVQWLLGSLITGIKLSGLRADHLSPYSANVKNAWSYISTSPYFCMAWCLVKYRNSFPNSVTGSHTFQRSLLIIVKYVKCKWMKVTG